MTIRKYLTLFNILSKYLLQRELKITTHYIVGANNTKIN